MGQTGFSTLARKILALVTSVAGLLLIGHAFGGEPKLRDEFLRLCDAGYPIVEKQARTTERIGRAYYWDSYLVRALAVAYDMTDKEEYLEACKRWSDRMIEHQQKMIPKGGYYMQYGRRPGEDQGNWYVADCSSIALGVLATAVRCPKSHQRQRYLDSVESFAGLVADNFVRPSGGVTDGYWPKSDKEWWCSTGIYGSLAFCLYNETGDDRYLKIGLGTIDWLNRQDLLTVAKHYPPETIKPTVMMYCLEAYSAGLPHLPSASQRRQEAMAQLAKAYKWMMANWGGQAGIDYISQWGSKFGGLPFHMYVYAKHLPHGRHVTAGADEELRHIAGVLRQAPHSNQRDQLALFAMMSYAEKLSPGAIYRSSKR